MTTLAQHARKLDKLRQELADDHLRLTKIATEFKEVVPVGYRQYLERKIQTVGEVNRLLHLAAVELSAYYEDRTP